MAKADRLTESIISEIKSGAYGKAGSRFLKVREICNKYNVSLVTAVKIKDLLLKSNYIIEIGKKNFISSILNVKEANETNVIGLLYGGKDNFSFDYLKALNDYAEENGSKLLIEIAGDKIDTIKELDLFKNLKINKVIFLDVKILKKAIKYARESGIKLMNVITKTDNTDIKEVLNSLNK